ncbi:MAG: polyprenyl synthetase family protein [Candidatus Eisenbacteria bacterium]|nr:polyprenyl synthetase family protein [Candidatus Eisenbacteria bacterium]
MASLLEPFVSRERGRIESVLRDVLPAARARPVSVHRAMRYAVLSGGKRIRPLMCVMAYRACGGRGGEVYRAAAAIELIHNFTLIHDDLPCMDDDELRRGRPTVHVKFGEAVALLAGDALLSLAFELVATLAVSGGVAPGKVVGVIHEIAGAAGTRGVVGGQVVDIESEGRRVPLSTVTYIHTRKTGVLMACSLRVGGLLAGAGPRNMKALSAYGERLGLAFQIVDDVRDVSATPRELGKKRGRDVERAKATYPLVLGRAESLNRARRLAEEAKLEAVHFGKHGACFCELADYVVRRGTPQEG